MSSSRTIFCSSCLLGKRCLYHGWRCTFALPVLRDLESRGFRIVDACAEMLGGLSCPRRPSYVTEGRVWQSCGRGRREVTAEFILGAEKALKILIDAKPEIALLLKNSPACDPGFGIFGKQVAGIVPTISCKRGSGWEADLSAALAGTAAEDRDEKEA